MSESRPVLDEEARRAVRRQVARWRNRPPPRDTRSVGCVLTLASLAALLLLPLLEGLLPLPGPVRRIVGAGLLVLALVGALLALVTSGDGFGRTVLEVEEARRALAERHSGTDRGRAEAATRLLLGAYHTSGPTTVSTFDVDEVRAELGESLALVEAVERLLVEEGEIYPVFTADPADDGDAGTPGPSTPQP